MSFIVEDGTGVVEANAYIDVAFFNSYHTDRGVPDVLNQTFDTTAIQQAIVRATDYIEQRWSLRFKGSKEFRDVSVARATLVFVGQPSNAETVTIGGTVYTFNTVLGGANSVLIGNATADSIQNLVRAILADSAWAGTSFGIGTIANAGATASEGIGDTLVAEAIARGTPGNSVSTTDTIANASWTSATLVGGGDVQVPQPLSFPRVNLLDRDGVFVGGIPSKLKQATAEYALRALTKTLLPDPTVDDSGRLVTATENQVGPIRTKTQFEVGNTLSQLLRPYPVADRLLSDYLLPAGGVERG